MSVRQTSIDAYRSIIENDLLSPRRREVYETLWAYGGPATANELFRKMPAKKMNQANIGTRLGELRDRGVVEELPERKCSVTGLSVIVWEVTGRLPIKLNKAKELTIKEYFLLASRLVYWVSPQVKNEEWQKLSKIVIEGAMKYRKKK